MSRPVSLLTFALTVCFATHAAPGQACTTDSECFPRPNVCYTPICCSQDYVDDGWCAVEAIGSCTVKPRLYADINEDGIPGKLFDIFAVLDIIAGNPWGATFEQADIVGNADSPCTPNGVVNLFEVFACLDRVSGIDPCCGGFTPAACCVGTTCSLEFQMDCHDLDGFMVAGVSSCTPDPCASPAPAYARTPQHAVRPTRHYAAPVEIKLVPSTRKAKPGDTVDIHVFATGVTSIRGYEVKAAITGGRRGSLELVSASIQDRRDTLMRGPLVYSAVNDISGRIVVATPDPFEAPEGTVYLGTYAVRATDNAYGTFQIGLDDDPNHLIAADAFGDLYTITVTPATFAIVRPRDAR